MPTPTRLANAGYDRSAEMDRVRPETAVNVRSADDGDSAASEGAHLRAAHAVHSGARMLWCDDDVLLAYADLIDAVDALRAAWRRYPERARLEHAIMLVEERMDHAFEERAADEAEIAVHDAFVGVVALGQLLLGEREVRCADEREPWDDRDTWQTSGGDTGDDELEQAWRMVGVVLDSLTPYVSRADDALRRVLLEGEALEDALLRIEKCA